MILMRVRDDDRIDGTIRNELELRQPKIAAETRMQSAIEHHAFAREVDLVGICANLDRSGQPCESNGRHAGYAARTMGTTLPIGNGFSPIPIFISMPDSAVLSIRPMPGPARRPVPSNP